MVSRYYAGGIVRKGRPSGVTLEDVARAMKWERPTADLLDEGWIGEEPAA